MNQVVRISLFGLGAVIVAVLLFWILWFVPKYQADNYRAQFNDADVKREDKILFEKNIADIENTSRVTFAQILGGIVLLSGLYFTYQNLRVTEEGKFTDRFSSAVNLLGNADLQIRLGGIYALERLAVDSTKDYWTIFEILTAFIRDKSGWDQDKSEGKQVKPPKTDVQAAMTVIGRRHRRFSDSEPRLDLIGVDFRRADLIYANFRGADLADSHFEGADLRGADFEGSNLKDAHFEWTDFNGRGADLRYASLKYTKLIRADLSKADLRGADFKGADLTDADLTDADFSSAKNVKWEQIKSAQNFDKALLPPYLENKD